MWTRRSFLEVVATSAAAATAAGGLRGVGTAAQMSTPLRRSLGEMDLDDPDLDSLREFVTLMKDPARAGAPVSWTGFADVHGSNGRFNFCPHGNWYFTPWHRAYLKMYEDAVRAFTGNSTFALPYWDWTTDRQMPRALADDRYEGRANPLFVANRRMRPNDSLPDEIVGQQRVMDGIYAERNFEAFGSTRPRGQNSLDSQWIHRRGNDSRLEATPHNNIHGIVGGPFMGSAASPRDPIFLMHHCNIDRIWAQWNALGRANSTDPLWRDMRFTDNFIRPDGTRYSEVVADLLDVESLDYSYGLPRRDTLPDDAGRTLFLSTLFGSPETLESGGVARLRGVPGAPAEATRPLSVPLDPPAAALQRAVDLPVGAETEAAGLRPPQVYAVIRSLDPASPDSTQLRVFVNCDYLSQTVPISDPHYVTTVGFFGADAHPDQRPSALVNLTSALVRLERGKRLNLDQVVVQILPVPAGDAMLDDVGAVSVEDVELVVI